MNNTKIFPACYVEFDTDISTRGAAFYLAAEEYMARKMPADNYVFIWQLRPTCVFGRNQDASVELDLNFCKQNGVDVMRRRSGGGAVFADENNLMISLVTGTGSVEELFRQFSQTVAGGLRQLGVPASVSGRNDIVVEGVRKICGGAFYHLKGRNIVHTTMLYDTNPRLMQGCLTPGRAKMESKGVKSVESRIGLLKEYLHFGVDELRRQLAGILTDRHIRLSAHDISKIETIEKPYHNPEYLFPAKTTRHAFAPLMFSGRIEGCGSITMEIYSDAEGTVQDLKMTGDFFQAGAESPREAFMLALKSCRIDRNNAAATINHLKDTIIREKPYLSVRNLTLEGMLSLLDASES